MCVCVCADLMDKECGLFEWVSANVCLFKQVDKECEFGEKEGVRVKRGDCQTWCMGMFV